LGRGSFPAIFGFEGLGLVLTGLLISQPTGFSFAGLGLGSYPASFGFAGLGLGLTDLLVSQPTGFSFAGLGLGGNPASFGFAGLGLGLTDFSFAGLFGGYSKVFGFAGLLISQAAGLFRSPLANLSSSALNFPQSTSARLLCGTTSCISFGATPAFASRSEKHKHHRQRHC
jgi:hypothetical protein